MSNAQDADCFQGRVAFVTGAAGGVGAGIARALGRAGCRLAISDVRSEALQSTRNELVTAGAEVIALPLDVTDCAASYAAADEVERHYGKVHIVVNNAGVGHSGTPLDQVSHQAIRWLFDVNVFGVMNVMKAFVPKLRRHGEGGHIVNTASMSGLQARWGWHHGLYTATKMAVVALSEGMREALQDTGIGVSTLCPGLITSDIQRNSDRLQPIPGEIMVKASPMGDEGRMSPDEAAIWVLRGIADNRAIIVTHPEQRRFVEAYYRRLIEAFEEADNLSLSIK